MNTFPIEWINSWFSHEEDETLGDDRSAVVDFVEDHFQIIFGITPDSSESVEEQVAELIYHATPDELDHYRTRAIEAMFANKRIG